jgi:hypothetical protein
MRDGADRLTDRVRCGRIAGTGKLVGDRGDVGVG